MMRLFKVIARSTKFMKVKERQSVSEKGNETIFIASADYTKPIKAVRFYFSITLTAVKLRALKFSYIFE